MPPLIEKLRSSKKYFSGYAPDWAEVKVGVTITAFPCPFLA